MSALWRRLDEEDCGIYFSKSSEGVISCDLCGLDATYIQKHVHIHQHNQYSNPDIPKSHKCDSCKLAVHSMDTHLGHTHPFGTNHDKNIDIEKFVVLGNWGSFSHSDDEDDEDYHGGNPAAQSQTKKRPSQPHHQSSAASTKPSAKSQPITAPQPPTPSKGTKVPTKSSTSRNPPTQPQEKSSVATVAPTKAPSSSTAATTSTTTTTTGPATSNAATASSNAAATPAATTSTATSTATATAPTTTSSATTLTTTTKSSGSKSGPNQQQQGSTPVPPVPPSAPVFVPPKASSLLPIDPSVPMTNMDMLIYVGNPPQNEKMTETQLLTLDLDCDVAKAKQHLRFGMGQYDSLPSRATAHFAVQRHEVQRKKFTFCLICRKRVHYSEDKLHLHTDLHNSYFDPQTAFRCHHCRIGCSSLAAFHSHYRQSHLEEDPTTTNQPIPHVVPNLVSHKIDFSGDMWFSSPSSIAAAGGSRVPATARPKLSAAADSATGPPAASSDSDGNFGSGDDGDDDDGDNDDEDDDDDGDEDEFGDIGEELDDGRRSRSSRIARNIAVQRQTQRRAEAKLAKAKEAERLRKQAHALALAERKRENALAREQRDAAAAAAAAAAVVAAGSTVSTAASTTAATAAGAATAGLATDQLAGSGTMPLATPGSARSATAGRNTPASNNSNVAAGRKGPTGFGSGGGGASGGGNVPLLDGPLSSKNGSRHSQISSRNASSQTARGSTAMGDGFDGDDSDGPGALGAGRSRGSHSGQDPRSRSSRPGGPGNVDLSDESDDEAYRALNYGSIDLDLPYFLPRSAKSRAFNRLVPEGLLKGFQLRIIDQEDMIKGYSEDLAQKDAIVNFCQQQVEAKNEAFAQALVAMHKNQAEAEGAKARYRREIDQLRVQLTEAQERLKAMAKADPDGPTATAPASATAPTAPSGSIPLLTDPSNFIPTTTSPAVDETPTPPPDPLAHPHVLARISTILAFHHLHTQGITKPTLVKEYTIALQAIAEANAAMGTSTSTPQPLPSAPSVTTTTTTTTTTASSPVPPFSAFLPSLGYLVDANIAFARASLPDPTTLSNVATTSPATAAASTTPSTTTTAPLPTAPIPPSIPSTIAVTDPALAREIAQALLADTVANFKSPGQIDRLLMEQRRRDDLLMATNRVSDALYGSKRKQMSFNTNASQPLLGRGRRNMAKNQQQPAKDADDSDWDEEGFLMSGSKRQRANNYPGEYD